MEIFNREYGRPDDEDDKEESGPADQEKPSQPQPVSHESTPHYLRMAEPGLHNLMQSEQRQAHITLNELLRPTSPLPEEAKQDEEDDDEDGEEDKKKEQTQKKEESEQQEDGSFATEETPTVAEPEQPAAVIQAKAEDEPDQQEEAAEEQPLAASSEPTGTVDSGEAEGGPGFAASFKTEITEEQPVYAAEQNQHPAEQVYHPPHDALTGPAAQQDRSKFQEMMELEYEEEHPVAKAASGENVTSPEQGEPPAVEMATNPNVTLEPEPVHRVEGYRSEDGGQQFEGYVPGGGEPGSVYEPAPAPAGQARQSFGSEAARTIAAPEAPVPTPGAGLREPLNALRDRFDRMDQRRRNVMPWIVTGAVLAYLANRRRKREIGEVQQDLQQAEKARQAEAKSAATAHQELRQQAAAQREQIERLEHQQTVSPHERGEPAPAPSAPLSSSHEATPPAAPAGIGQEAAPSSAAPQPGELHRPQPTVIKPEIAEPVSDTEAARQAVEEALQAAEEQKTEEVITQDAWLRHVVDKETGREVTGAVRHGHEFDEERRSETFAGVRPSDQSRQAHTPPGAGAGQSMPSGGYPLQDTSTQPIASDHMLYGGQEPADHSLPPGSSQADLEHRLPEKHRRPIVEALTSPWLFLLLSLILLAYFIASLL